MILAIDVQYTNDKGITAGVLFDTWSATSPLHEFLSTTENVEKYIPGQFYKRELPCILKLLTEHKLSPEVIVIDGYVFLDGVIKPGLGKYLYDALETKATVIGVAKKSFQGIEDHYAITRGDSKNPIYITVIGDDLTATKANILAMTGEYRIPTLLKRADQLCRETVKSEGIGK